ncbi:MAG: 4-hydroxy-tetrahydrodipicolinate reductase [Clostridia bacterium]|nr:4-hydroxy-tetrahydrodipicolinate reductase [Clostridia bacterium]
MKNVLLHGVNGRMGQILTSLIAADPELTLVAGVDVRPGQGLAFPVYEKLSDCREQVDVVIDFSVPRAVPGLIEYCVEKKLPLVLCTTGLEEEHLHLIDEAAKKIPLLQSANMSLGINLLLKLLKENSAMLAKAGYDIEIVERHHRNKTDAPSGTAMSLAAAANTGLNYPYRYCRQGDESVRPTEEIGISCVRGGSIVGEHEICYLGSDEIVSFHHGAYSRAVFGKGALAAAKFLADQAAGRYTMADVLK